eukprot:3000376-Karenia_brevis.AAC.1
MEVMHSCVLIAGGLTLTTPNTARRKRRTSVMKRINALPTMQLMEHHVESVEQLPICINIINMLSMITPTRLL